MLKPFYDYLIKKILIPYLRGLQNQNGERYYVILDNRITEGKQPFDYFYDAIRAVSDEITISGIFHGSPSAIQEEEYKTLVINANGLATPVIVGTTKNSTEDYLVTMRNSIGEPGGKYEKYSSLFVLSERPNNSANPLSSICTTCKDLCSSGGPFSPKYIISNIMQEIDGRLTRDHEKIYFKVYLNEIGKHIEDGSSSLYDLMPALSVLEEGTIRNRFNDLSFFFDPAVVDPQNILSDEQIEARAKTNSEIFRTINEVMSIEDDLDKSDKLQKVLDEKLSLDISRDDKQEWKNIDFQRILDSIEKKKQSDDIALESIQIIENESNRKPDYYICKGRKNKKTTNYIIVCKKDKDSKIKIKASFNKLVAKNNYDKYQDIERSGKSLYFSLSENGFNMYKIGRNDNHHDFYVLVVCCSNSFFDSINNIFSISKKGELIFDISPDQSSVMFGASELVEQIEADACIAYDESKSYLLKVEEDPSEDYSLSFNILFADFLLKVRANVKTDGASTVDPINNPEKRDDICKWEDEFIRNRCTRLVVERNDLLNIENVLPLSDQIEPEIKKRLDDLFSYYSSQKAGPTLLGINQESKVLFENYLSSVIESLSSIQNGSLLPNEKYFLTKLGVVEYGDKLYFSSFHPLMVAYFLEYNSYPKPEDDFKQALELISPFYLAPYICYNDNCLHPCVDVKTKKYKNWLCFEKVSSKSQGRAVDITTNMVCDKINEFIQHFEWLFKSESSPIIISTFGINDDRNVIKGILRFFASNTESFVQNIELHEYTSNIMVESFLEKLNRLKSNDLIVKEIESLGIKDAKTETAFRMLSHLVLYKHKITDDIKYSHISFYQIDSDVILNSSSDQDSLKTQYVPYPMDQMRGELAFNGLVSIPSTANNKNMYFIGFGTHGVPDNTSILYKTARLTNNLYANEKNSGGGAYQTGVCVAKKHVVVDSKLLDSVYDKTNWVTFLNPEVDIDFFYKQSNLYVIHYTDQYSINAKYDSITVTKQVEQYKNIIRNSYRQYDLSPDLFERFECIMARYFNCLNGNWLLDMVNKSQNQINEKMSIVAASIVMQRFMKKIMNVIWIPISLDEILRVSGSIRLPKHFIFTKDDLGAKGALSDDLLMMGLDAHDINNLQMYLYPIEVKYSKNVSFSEKGGKQVSHTYQQIFDHLFGEETFIKKIYKTFFASQFLVNSEKLNANELIDKDDYTVVERCRYNLLNLNFTFNENITPNSIGKAALISFFSNATHDMKTSEIDGVNVCEIHFAESECFKIIADADSSLVDCLIKEQFDFLFNDTIPPQQIVFDQSNSPTDEEGQTYQVPSTLSDHIVCTSSQVFNDSTHAEDSSPTTVMEHLPSIPLVPQDQDGSELRTDSSDYRGIRIILGSVINSNREIIFEPNNSKIVSHPNMGIIGTMGTGKTQFARSVVAQLSRSSKDNINEKPIGILIFDYKGDYKDEAFLKITKGQSYIFNLPFNPLKLIITPGLDGMNLPAVTADRISDSFAKAYGLGLRQQGNIKKIIIDTYEKFGITRDPSTWNNKPPTMNDVIEKYFETFDSNDKTYVFFDKLRDYNIFASNDEACVSIFEWLDRVQVIDLTLYPDDTKRVIVSLILDLFYSEMRQLGESVQKDGYRQLRSFILVDEAHQFLKKDFNSLRSIISEGRGFGVGVILSTQNLSDFHTANQDYTQFILSWIIHHVNSISRAEISSIFGSTDQNAERYMSFINNAKVFESICKNGKSINSMRDLPFFELIERGI